jgi:hypothetical protein
MVGRMRRFLVGFAAAGVLLAAGTIGVAAGGNGQQLSLHDVGENVYSANVYGDSNSCAYRQLAIRYWINQDYEMANDWWPRSVRLSLSTAGRISPGTNSIRTA